MQEDLEVTGISRSGRVRKKSSKLMDFESPDDIDSRFRRAPVKAPGGRQEEMEVPPSPRGEPPRPPEDAGTASGSESDFYENAGDNADSMESDSSASDEGGPRPGGPGGAGGVATSLYMMEKSSKKKLIIKDGRVVGRAKAQRKDKGKSRVTAYMLWAREARNELLRQHPDMDFSAVSKRLGEMWANVNYNERYAWKRRAKRFAMQQSAAAAKGAAAAAAAHGGGGGRGAGGGAAAAGGGGRGRAPPRAALPAPQPPLPTASPAASTALVAATAAAGGGGARGAGCGAVEIAAHLRLLGESLAIIGERLKEHEGQIAVSGSVSVLLDTLVCALAPLVCITRALPALAPHPPPRLLQDTLHHVAYIMPGL